MGLFTEFKTKDKNGEKSYTFNRNNINYFRNWVTDDSGLWTMIYLKSSDRGVKIPFSTEVVKKQLQSENELEILIDDMSLSEKRELIAYIKQKEALEVN